jgi:hypothetical protein
MLADLDLLLIAVFCTADDLLPRRVALLERCPRTDLSTCSATRATPIRQRIESNGEKAAASPWLHGCRTTRAS